MPTTDYTVPHHVRPAIAQLANTPTGLALRQWDDAGDSNLKSAHQALLDAQRRLQTDAKAYFTRLAMPRAPAVLDRDGAPAHLADRLGALLRRDGGIVLGGMPLPPIDSTPLIALLATLKQQGAGTLFIAGLLADVHQDALDRCVSEPQTPLPDTLTAFAGATMTRLLQGARQHGYRLVALDCAATVANAALAPRERAEIANYFAQLVIGEYASQPTHALWLAWLDETRLSRFDDVPGMAALTGAAGVRLRLASAQPAMRQDHGEQVVRTDGTRYWVKSDWLLSSHPLIGQARLRARLHDAGTFAIVARPESGEFELCHRAHDLSLITTPIQRDHVSPQLFFIERDDAGAHWQPVLRRRYRDLSALRQALQEIEMVDAWPDATPVLETAALGDAGERRAGVIALPDAVTPTSGLRVYEHGGEDAAQLEAIAREESRGLDLRYVSPLLSEPDRQLRKRFASKRERLLTDAALFFRQPTLPARPPMPTLAPELAMAEALNRLLAHYPGIVFGESHQDCHSKQLLIEHMPALHSAGVRTLYFEHLLADRHQPLLDAWHADPGAPMPAALQSYLQWQDRGQRVAGNANFTALAQAAHRHGIAIVAIDCFSSYFTKDLLGAFDRQQLMNYYAMRRIEARQSQMPGAKWIALVGSTHVTRFGNVPGLMELTGATGLFVRGAPVGIRPDVGAWVSTWSNDATPQHFLRADWVTSALPPLPEPTLQAKLEVNGDFVIVAHAAPAVAAYALYYRDGERIVALPVTRSGTGKRLTLPAPPWKAAYGQHFADVASLAQFLQQRQAMRDVAPLSRGSFSESSGEAAAETAEQTAPVSERFERQRQSVLLCQVFFADGDSRAAFKAGKAGWQHELPALGLATDAPLDRLKAVFAWQAATLFPRQQGALLAAIGERQAALAAQQTVDWQTQAALRGGMTTRRIAHNRYLAAAGHQQGMCASLTAHLAAVWLTDRRQGGNSHFDGYLNGLEAAIRQPDTPEARLLDLALVAWRLAPDKQAFGRHPPASGLSVADVLARLDAAAAPAVFELALGSHAMLLAKGGTTGAEGYVLADPNFGRCDIPSRQALPALLDWHGKLMRQLFSPDAAKPVFSLRRYRDDLPEQSLFAANKVGPPLKALRLADLGALPALAEADFGRLARRLTVADYRRRLQTTGAEPFAALLGELLDRHQAPVAMTRAPARAIRIAFRGEDAFITLRGAEGLALPPLRIDGASHSEDVARLRQVKALLHELTDDNTLARIGRLLLPRRAPAWEVDRQVLTAALPDPLPSPPPHKESTDVY